MSNPEEQEQFEQEMELRKQSDAMRIGAQYGAIDNAYSNDLIQTLLAFEKGLSKEAKKDLWILNSRALQISKTDHLGQKIINKSIRLILKYFKLGWKADCERAQHELLADLRGTQSLEAETLRDITGKNVTISMNDNTPFRGGRSK